VEMLVSKLPFASTAERFSSSSADTALPVSHGMWGPSPAVPRTARASSSWHGGRGRTIHGSSLKTLRLRTQLRVERVPAPPGLAQLVAAIAHHTEELPPESASPFEHYRRGANDAWNLWSYFARNIRRANVYYTAYERHATRLRSMVLLSLVEASSDTSRRPRRSVWTTSRGSSSMSA
jgi:hypothetical protein